MRSSIEWQDATKTKPDDGEEVLIESTDQIWYLGIYNYNTKFWEETTDYVQIVAKWWSYIPETPGEAS